MKIAVVGLGKMGSQVAQKLSEAGFEIISHRRDSSREATLRAFKDERPIIWLMIPAEGVDLELNEWLKLLPKESIVVDGGNSDFRLTKSRAERADKYNV